MGWVFEFVLVLGRTLRLQSQTVRNRLAGSTQSWQLKITPMTEITLQYAAKLLESWKNGNLVCRWYLSHRDTFSRSDLSNAISQPSYHFGEWFTARHFLKQGYEVLSEKFLLRQDKRRKATHILGKDGVAFLERKRRLGGSKLRWPPTPDLLVFKSKPKTFFFVEVKKDRDKLSAAQQHFFPMIGRKFGCNVLVVWLVGRHFR
jgi:hypothetical protein